jgi:hypothetical protein
MAWKFNPFTGKLDQVNPTGSSAPSSLSVETPAGAKDDANTSFTVANAPVFIVVNGGAYTVGTGIYTSYGAGTIALSTPVGTGGFIISFY